MKHRRYFLFAAAVAALLACEKVDTPADDSPEKADGSVAFKAVIGSDNVSKAVLELNGSSKPQTFWENGDQITVYSGNGDSGSKEGCNFSTSLVSNSTSAEFTYTGEGWTSGTGYLAIYPAATAARTVNFTGDGDIYKMAAVDVPSSQTLVAGGFDKSAAVLTAYSTGSTLNFKNAVALLKFQVSDAGIVAGKIIVDDDDKISGRFRADLGTTSPYEPTLNDYSVTGVVQYNFVDFSLGGSALAVGTDYYVAVRPTVLTSGFKVYLNGNLVKSFTSSQVGELVRNKIYNLGTLTIPASPAEKVLDFDFTCAPLDGWPTAANAATRADGGMQCTYPLYGTDYTLVLADPSGATGSNIFWSNNSTASYGYRLAFAAQYRYLGLPAIPGWKLTHVTCVSSQLNAGAKSTKPKVGVVAGIVGASETPEVVTGGDEQTWAAGNYHQAYHYPLSGTSVNTMYYLYASVKGALASVSATYVPVD